MTDPYRTASSPEQDPLEVVLSAIDGIADRPGLDVNTVEATLLLIAAELRRIRELMEKRQAPVVLHPMRVASDEEIGAMLRDKERDDD